MDTHTDTMAFHKTLLMIVMVQTIIHEHHGALCWCSNPERYKTLSVFPDADTGIAAGGTEDGRLYSEANPLQLKHQDTRSTHNVVNWEQTCISDSSKVNDCASFHLNELGTHQYSSSYGVDERTLLRETFLVFNDVLQVTIPVNFHDKI